MRKQSWLGKMLLVAFSPIFCIETTFLCDFCDPIGGYAGKFYFIFKLANNCDENEFCVC
jgi:hypothetical protein